MNVAEAMLADRTRRREGNRKTLSREKYAELIGMTVQRVWSIEKGKRLKPGELEHVRPWLGDLLDEDTELPTEAPAPLNNESRPIDMGSDDYAAERRGLAAAYSYLLQRMHELKAPDTPYPWPSTHRIDSCAVADFTKIRAWIQSVHEWLDKVGPTPEPPPVQDEPEKITYLDDLDLDDEDWCAWLPPESEANEPEPVPQVTEPEPEPEPEPVPVIAPQPEGPLDPAVRYFTNSELKTYKQCRRRWWLGYYRRLGLRDPEIIGPASVGTRVHRILQAYYVPEGVPREDPWVVFERTVADDKLTLDQMDADEDTRQKWAKEVDLARAIVEGYFQWAEENAVDATLRIVAPEARLVADPKIPGHDDVRLLAKIDVRAVRTVDNARVFLDHKTVQDLTTPQKTLHLDEQMLHYHLVEYLDLVENGGTEDQRTQGALYNMLRKVKRTANAKPPFYGRVEVHHNIEELRSYWLRIRETISDIRRLEDDLVAGMDPRQVAYPNPTRDCTWKCEFFMVCPMFDDGSNVEGFLSTYFVNKNPLARYGRSAE